MLSTPTLARARPPLDRITLRKWVSRAKELEDEERDLKLRLPGHCQQVLKRNRIILFKEMLVACNYEDQEIVFDMSVGFKLSGPIPPSKVLRPKRSHGSLTVASNLGA